MCIKLLYSIWYNKTKLMKHYKNISNFFLDFFNILHNHISLYYAVRYYKKLNIKPRTVSDCSISCLTLYYARHDLKYNLIASIKFWE